MALAAASRHYDAQGALDHIAGGVCGLRVTEGTAKNATNSTGNESINTTIVADGTTYVAVSGRFDTLARGDKPG
jgi:hypothetical protein